MLCLNGLSSFCSVPGQVLPSYGMSVCLHCLRAVLNPFENCEASRVLVDESDHCLHLNCQRPQIPFPFFFAVKTGGFTKEPGSGSCGGSSTKSTPKMNSKRATFKSACRFSLKLAVEDRVYSIKKQPVSKSFASKKKHIKRNVACLAQLGH